MNELDKIDIQLLKALQENARTSIKELASQVYLSSPATASRISRMEKMGYIKGYTVIEGESELGYPIKAIINIQTDRKGRESLFSFIYRCPVSYTHLFVLRMLFFRIEEVLIGLRTHTL